MGADPVTTGEEPARACATAAFDEVTARVRGRGNQPLHLMVGPACNNRCAFCMEGERFDAEGRIGHLPAEAVFDLLATGAPGGSVCFTSGEPTLAPRLSEYVRRARDAGFRDLSLITNGRRLADERRARELLAAGLTTITVSVHAPRAALHDALTGVAGSFAQTGAALANLARLKGEFRFRLVTNTVITRPLLPLLGEHLRFLAARGADVVTLSAPNYSGRMARAADALAAAYPDIVAALLECGLCRVRPAYEVRVEDAPPCALLALPSWCRGWKENGANHFSRPASDTGHAARVHRHERARNEAGARAFRLECYACAAFPRCEGVWRPYLRRFGWRGLDPMSSRSALVARPATFPALSPPRCCEAHGRRAAGRGSLAALAAAETREPSPLLNPFAGDWSLIRWVPCRFDCPEAVKSARRAVESARLTPEHRRRLAMPILVPGAAGAAFALDGWPEESGDIWYSRAVREGDGVAGGDGIERWDEALARGDTLARTGAGLELRRGGEVVARFARDGAGLPLLLEWGVGEGAWGAGGGPVATAREAGR
ncbi:MAG: radical SAM protein [Planctomycetes bacterium]|nr:radical SAM protein [Planctomycetota bacterium]